MNGGYRYGCDNKNKIETRYTAIRKDRKPIGYKVDLCNISKTNLVTESGVKLSLLQIYSHDRVSIFLILFIRNCRRNIARLWLSFNYSKTPIYLALIYRVPIYWVPRFTGPDKSGFYSIVQHQISDFKTLNPIKVGSAKFRDTMNGKTNENIQIRGWQI